MTTDIEEREDIAKKMAIDKEREEKSITPRMKELVYELKRAYQAYQSNYGRCKEIVMAIVNQGRNDGMVDLQIRDFLEKSLVGIMSERSMRSYIPKELRLYKTNWPDSNVDDKKQIEQSESDDIDETHDERSENKINDAVKASMNHHHIEDLEEGINPNAVYDYKGQKEENKIRFELKQDVEKLRQQLEEKEGINELLRREIEDSKNQKLEAKILDIEELNKNLKVENEQLRHALTKRSFETAKEMEEKADPELVRNLEDMIRKLQDQVADQISENSRVHKNEVKEKAYPDEIANYRNYIKDLESVNSDRYKKIQELQQEIESFSHLDKIVEPQPLELDLTDNSGFLGKFFSYRGRRVWMLHDGHKIINVKLGGEIKKK